VQPPNYIFAHNFDNPISKLLFTSGVQQAADSLAIESVILSLHESYDKHHLDSLFKKSRGIGYAPPLENELISDYLDKAFKKQKPIIQFENAEPDESIYRFINSDSYTAGRAAAQHIIDEFGDNGRFGILTPTLNNPESTEAIRGFRDKFSKTKWKQVNIITCGNEFEQALKQYRYATRFGNRIIWFVANDCPDFLHELKNLKKDNFFIAIDLHPNENNIKFLQENLLDAVATKNFAAMGRLCVTELASAPQELNEIESETINCGSTVLTSAQVLELLK
jgi:ABC-type sugar transport system substrate-binding protein